MIRTLKFMAGIAACAATAALLTTYLRDVGTIRLAAPAICLQVVIATALLAGRIPALIGALLADLMFALWLFPPYGTAWVSDPTERVVLTLFLIASLVITMILPRPWPRAGRATEQVE